MKKQARARTDPLEESEYFELDAQYQVTPQRSESFGASGEHYRLVALLRSYGYSVTGDRFDWLDLAGELLAKGWVSDGTYKA